MRALNVFEQANARDADHARLCLMGYDVSCMNAQETGNDGHTYLTYAGAVFLADLYHVERETVSVKSSRMNRTHDEPRGVPCFHAVVRTSVAGASRLGASSSKFKEIAVELAFRNAVRQLVHPDGPRVWKEKPPRVKK